MRIAAVAAVFGIVVLVALAGGQPPVTMSFPHGRYDAAIAARARAAGYELVFTSDPVLNPIDPRPGGLLGRVGFEQSGIVDRSGAFRADRLALLLFRTRTARLEAD